MVWDILHQCRPFRCASFSISLLTTIHVTAAAQSLPRTPQAGSAERRAILDALRPSIEQAVGAHVIFADVHMTVADGWAYEAAVSRRKPPMVVGVGDTYATRGVPPPRWVRTPLRTG